jgi:hypothetical protein
MCPSLHYTLWLKEWVYKYTHAIIASIKTPL